MSIHISLSKLEEQQVPQITVFSMVVGLITWGIMALLTAPWSPSCSWPLRVAGNSTYYEAGVVRCYVRDLAERDTAGLYAIADYDPPVRITNADLKYSTDARTGVATAYFWPSPVDDSEVAVVIAFADGVKENTALTNMDAMGDSSTWRMVIGSNSGG